MTAIAKRLLREPLVHFLLLGGLMFAIYAAIPNRNADPNRTIVVSAGRIESLKALFARTWGHPPTPQQLDGLIQEYVRDEVFYREGLAMGLDRDDVVVRSRIAEKMRFTDEGLAPLTEPTDGELQAYLDAHRLKFDVEPSVTLVQVFLDAKRHGVDLVGDTAQLLAELRRAGSHADLTSAGDETPLPHRLDDASISEVKSVFGDAFAAAIASLPTGVWSGPVPSEHGVHLVLVASRTEGRARPLAEVKDAVRREWSDERQREANERFYQSLLKRYTVRIEPPVENAR